MANKRKLLHFLAGEGSLGPVDLRRQLEQGVYADQATWHRYLRIILLTLGLGFLACGIVFFLAYNWADMPKPAKIGLATGGVVLPAGLSLFFKDKPLLENSLLTAAAFMVGGLFAVLGQIYQTGADAYDLFLVWTLFILVWVVMADFAALWLLFLMLVNTTVYLYAEQLGANWADWCVYLLLAGINTVALLLFNWRNSREIEQKKPRWLLLVLAITAAIMATIAFWIGLTEQYGDDVAMLPVALITLTTLGLGFLAYHRKALVYLSILALVVIAQGVGWCIYLDGDVLGFFLSACWGLGATVFSGFTLSRLLKKWRQDEGQQQTVVEEREGEEALIRTIVTDPGKRTTLLGRFQEESLSRSTLGLSLLRLLGSFLVLGTILGLLFSLDVLRDAQSYLLLGVLFLGIAIALDRSGKGVVRATLIIAGGLVGTVLFLLGCAEIIFSDKEVAGLSFFLCLILARVFREKVSVFLAAFGTCMSGLIWLLMNETLVPIHAYVVVLGGLLTVWTLLEDRLVSYSPVFHQRYEAVRLALVLGLLVSGSFVGKMDWLGVAGNTFAYSALIFIPLLVYLAYRRLQWFGVARQKLVPYLGGLTLLLLPLFFAPASAPALLVLLLGISIQDRVSIGLGALALIYFIGQFYYDLNQTLLFKSLVLLVSGGLLLGAYRLLHAKISRHETLR